MKSIMTFIYNRGVISRVEKVFYAPEQLLSLNMRISDPESEKQIALQCILSLILYLKYG